MSRAPHHGLDDRRARVLDVAAKNPDLVVKEIVERLGVSAHTVRRALGPDEVARRAALWSRR